MAFISGTPADIQKQLNANYSEHSNNYWNTVTIKEIMQSRVGEYILLVEIPEPYEGPWDS